MIEREKKRSKLVTTYATKRCQLKINMKTATSLKEKLQIQFEFQKLIFVFSFETDNLIGKLVVISRRETFQPNPS